MFGSESCGPYSFCASSILYLHKTLVQETLFFAIAQVCSPITISCFPNHTLNIPTDFGLHSLRPFQLLTDFS